MYDLIIIGGGPAGLTAAVYAIRKRLNVLLVSTDFGGKTNYHMVLPWAETHQIIRGVEIIDKFRRELQYLDYAHRLETVEDVTKKNGTFLVKLVDGTELTARSVILATGSRVKHLDVPGERDFIGRGVSYSAISYAPLFVGKHTTVIGEGNLALRAVSELCQVAATVHLVVPTRGVLDSPMAKELIADGMKVVVFEAYKVKAIQGKEFAERVILEAPDGQEAEINTDGIFVELGLLPNSSLVEKLANLDDQGRVVIDNRNRTNCLGLFAAGDVTDAFAEQVLIAVGEGAKAALSAYEYLLS
ncbi:MAG: NAD(P)/FAD-dependent oxidoreductase, partial [Anaerolineae bacterium]|nr:NAD(P)/FAD-dependent oxidoreductase [Anaerolineae bacterium]